MKDVNRHIHPDAAAPDPIQMAMQRAVDADIARQTALGNPIVVWEDDRIQTIFPHDHGSTGGDAAANSPVQTSTPMSVKESPDRQVICDANVCAAFYEMTANPDFLKKVAWWLESGYAAERWLQFEFAYALQQVIYRTNPAHYLVYPERERVDISVVDVSNGGYDQIAGNIELKVNANWYTEKLTFPNLVDDIKRKVDRYKVPSVLLSFWIVIEPVDDQPQYSWIKSQIQDRKVGRTRSELEERINAEAIQGLEKIATQPPSGSKGFPSGIEFWLYRYRNSLA